MCSIDNIKSHAKRGLGIANPKNAINPIKTHKDNMQNDMDLFANQAHLAEQWRKQGKKSKGSFLTEYTDNNGVRRTLLGGG